MSENGGHPKVGKLEFAATNPESAFDLPAMVIYTMFSLSLLSFNISNTLSGCLCADAACCSQAIPYSSSLSVIFFAWCSSDVEPIINIAFIVFPQCFH